MIKNNLFKKVHTAATVLKKCNLSQNLNLWKTDIVTFFFKNPHHNPFSSFSVILKFKALASEDTLLRTHCCRHKCFPVCPRALHLLRTQKNVSDFVQKHFVSATNVSQFAQPKKHHEQQCVRNNVSSFAGTFRTVYCLFVDIVGMLVIDWSCICFCFLLFLLLLAWLYC